MGLELVRETFILGLRVQGYAWEGKVCAVFVNGEYAGFDYDECIKKILERFENASRPAHAEGQSGPVGEAG